MYGLYIIHKNGVMTYVKVSNKAMAEEMYEALSSGASEVRLVHDTMKMTVRPADLSMFYIDKMDASA